MKDNTLNKTVFDPNASISTGNETPPPPEEPPKG